MRNEDSYILNTDEIAGGANKVMLDLFNATSSNRKLLITHLFITPKSDVAVTGVVSARFDIYRTSSAGTGGTANSFRSPSPSAINISPRESAAPSLLEQGLTNDNVISGIRARSAPSSGAAPKHWLMPAFVFPEETGNQAIAAQGINLVPLGTYSPGIVIDRNEGLMIQQGSVASVNSFVITLVFTLLGVSSN